MIRSKNDGSTEVRENMRGGKGQVTIKHYFKKEEFTSHTRLCARLVLPPGTSIGSHKHEGEDEVYIIQQGSGILDDGMETTNIQAGDAVLTGNGQSHAIRNDGEVDLIIIAVIMSY